MDFPKSSATMRSRSVDPARHLIGYSRCHIAVRCLPCPTSATSSCITGTIGPLCRESTHWLMVKMSIDPCCRGAHRTLASWMDQHLCDDGGSIWICYPLGHGKVGQARLP